jgi:hypothetical protein
MDAGQAARALQKALSPPPRGRVLELTIADAAARSGLALRDAEAGLHSLLSEYRGHLRVTSEGELLFRFPAGFTKPWETRTRLAELGRKVGRALLGVGRFVVRAWISIVLIGYALLFLALIVGLAFARSGDSRDSRGSGVGFEVGYVFFRVVLDALFWTFHPFSPFAYVDYAPPVGARARRTRKQKDETPFYDKVNRFFFGPDVPEPDPRAMERRLLAEIRAQKGRIGLADVIRVTGLPRDQADPLMSRLLLDYEGEVEVSEEGGIVYRFEALRKTVDERPVDRPRPIWERLKRLVPLTGNSVGTNIAIAGLNGFNLIMSLYALSEHLTFEKIGWFFQVAQHHLPRNAPMPTGTAVALGVVPLVFSLALFALPLARAALRPFKQRRIARENGRRYMLREILEHLGTGEVTDESLRRAWKEAAGVEPDPKELTREVVALGGDVDYEAGRVRYRFPDFEAEAKALEAERDAAAESEAKVGQVIFSSES